jgi:hypothetical protein
VETSIPFRPRLKVEAVGFGGADLRAYKDAAMKHHLKVKPSVTLNTGDVFSFQLAVKMNLPLFFQGKDFLKTPVKNAMKILGYEMSEQNLGVPTKPSPIFWTVIIRLPGIGRV